jgi:hypothetical protein
MAHPCRRAQNTGTCTEPASYAIPDMYWSDVVLEFGIGDTVNNERQARGLCGIDQQSPLARTGPGAGRRGPCSMIIPRWSVGKATLTSAAYGAPSIGGRLDHEAARRSRTLRRTEVKRCRGSRATGSAASSSTVKSRRATWSCCPSGSPPTWGRTDGHALVLDDHQDVRAELPEQLVVGTGGYTPILRP